MTPASQFVKTVYTGVRPQLISKFGKQPIEMLEALSTQVKPVKRSTKVNQAIKGTQLQSYLDKNYQKKCGVEVKQFDVATGAPVASTTGLNYFATPLINIAQGLTDTTRIGDTVEINSIQFKIDMYAGAASTAPTKVRLIIVKQATMVGAIPTPAQVLLNANNIRSFPILDKVVGFTVLKDVTFNLAAFSSGENSSVKRFIWNYYPKHCHSVKWAQLDTTGVLANMIYGNVTLYWMHENTSGAASAPSLVYWQRTKWLDV